MKMNLFRIKSLMTKEWDEQKKHYLLIWLVYFGVMAVCFTWINLMYVSDMVRDGYYTVRSAQDELWNSPLPYSFYLFFLLLAVASRGSDFMSGVTDRKGMQAYLSLPAATEEKFLVRWLFIVPFTYLMFYTAFFAADWIRILVCSSVYPDLEIFYSPVSKVLTGKILLLSLCGQSLFILGSTFWNKNGFIKTAAVLVAGAILWVAFYLTVSAQYEDPETIVVRPEWTDDALYWLLWVVLIVSYFLTYWRFRGMRLAYERMRVSTKVVLGLLILGVFSGLISSLYAQNYWRYPNENPLYIKDAVWYSLPAFRHLVLEDTLEVSHPVCLPEWNQEKGLNDYRVEMQGVRLDINLSVHPIDRKSSAEGAKQGIWITPELYPYLRTELHHDTLHLFFDYPAREKMRHEGKDYLNGMHVYAHEVQIRTDSLLSVRNRMHTVVELFQWETDSMALNGTSFRLRDCRLEALSIKADSTWITLRHIDEGVNQRANSMRLSNSTIIRLHEYQKEPAYWYAEDKRSRVGQAFLHAASGDNSVVATKQSDINSDITDALWKTEFGFPVNPFWKQDKDMEIPADGKS